MMLTVNQLLFSIHQLSCLLPRPSFQTSEGQASPSLEPRMAYDEEVSKTGIWCSGCNLPLCEKCGCFHEFHPL